MDDTPPPISTEPILQPIFRWNRFFGSVEIGSVEIGSIIFRMEPLWQGFYIIFARVARKKILSFFTKINQKICKSLVTIVGAVTHTHAHTHTHTYTYIHTYIYTDKHIHTKKCLSVCLPAWLYVCLSIWISGRPYGCLSICLSVCLSLCLSVSLYVCI